MKSANRKNIISVLAAASLGLTLFAAPLLANAPGQSAANFLKIGIGGRGSAMGNAQSALSDDVTGLHWNPATLSRLRFQEVSLMHYEIVEGVRYEQAAYAYPTQKFGTFAVGANLLDVGDIDSYDDADVRTGSVDASNLLITGGWAIKPLKNSNLMAGTALKYLRSDLAGYKANVPMLDLGVVYPFDDGKFRGLSMAAGLRNVGPKIEYESEESPLPREFVLGAALQTLGDSLSLAADLVNPNDNDPFLNIGAEYTIFNMVNLRMGWTGNSKFIGDGVTYGIGLKFNNWNVDYALVPFGDLGDSNRVSVGFKFGQAQRLRTAEEQVDFSYRQAERELANGQIVKAHSTVVDILQVAPWHKPSQKLKTKIEKQVNAMAEGKMSAELEADISKKFADAKAAFDRDELVNAKKGFQSILEVKPDHIGANAYLERIQNRYASLAQESYKIGMDHYADGDYQAALDAFEKTLTIDDSHLDALAQLEKTRDLLEDATARAEEMKRLAGAADAYEAGLKAYRQNNYEVALENFAKVRELAPNYEEVMRYETLTKRAAADTLFAESQIHFDAGQLKEATEKLQKASALAPHDVRIQDALRVAERDLRAKNVDESAKLFQQGIEAYLSGQNDKAESLWKSALELDPENIDAKTNLQKLEEQRSYEKNAE